MLLSYYVQDIRDAKQCINADRPTDSYHYQWLKDRGVNKLYASYKQLKVTISTPLFLVQHLAKQVHSLLLVRIAARMINLCNNYSWTIINCYWSNHHQDWNICTNIRRYTCELQMYVIVVRIALRVGPRNSTSRSYCSFAISTDTLPITDTLPQTGYCTYYG